MIKRIDNFDKKTPSDISVERISLSCGDEINVYTLKSVHDINQFIGYGKYINKSNGNVYMRGQTELYNGAMIPSLYRGKNKFESITTNYNKKICDAISGNKYFNEFDRSVFEPLVQHYGIKTPYIDIVDNVWVALWFALHQAKNTIIDSHEYIYYYENTNEYSYIVLMISDALEESPSIQGVYTGRETTLVDLRKALPSYYLRPHAQHAYMLRKNEKYPNDYSDLIVGIAKIPTQLGIKWLGTNDFLTLSSLFPAAYFDTGYSLMLKNYPKDSHGTVKHYGSIQILTD